MKDDKKEQPVPSKGVDAGSKNTADKKVCPRMKQRWKFCQFQHYFKSPRNSAWRKQMNATTPEFIISLLIRMVVDKMSSLLRYNSLNNSLLDCTCAQNDSETSYIEDLDLNWDCGGVWTDNGRLQASQNIPESRYVRKGIYSAKFPTACQQVIAQGLAYG